MCVVLCLFPDPIEKAPQYATTGVLAETDQEIDGKHLSNEYRPREYKLVWRNIILYIYLHISSLFAVYLIFTRAKLLTTLQGKT